MFIIITNCMPRESEVQKRNSRVNDRVCVRVGFFFFFFFLRERERERERGGWGVGVGGRLCCLLPRLTRPDSTDEKHV